MTVAIVALALTPRILRSEREQHRLHNGLRCCDCGASLAGVDRYESPQLCVALRAPVPGVNALARWVTGPDYQLGVQPVPGSQTLVNVVPARAASLTGARKAAIAVMMVERSGGASVRRLRLRNAAH